MSFIGTVGTVAQQGNQAGAGPTDVSIATAATGGNNNALNTEENTGLFHGQGYQPVFTRTFTGSIIDINLDHVETGYEADGLGHPGYITGDVLAYMRATGASTFEWDCAVLSEETSLSNSITASVTGADSGAQDGTSRDGTGFKFRITLPSSGSFPNVTYAMPAHGDVAAFRLRATAADAGGNETDATEVHFLFRFDEP